MQHDSHARRDRALQSFLQRNANRMSGRDETMAKAEAKRARKNAKRAVDAFNSHVGQLRAREELEAVWVPAGVTAQLVGLTETDLKPINMVGIVGVAPEPLA